MKAPTYRFGDVCVDLERVIVTRAGATVDLEPKAFDVLRTLLEHRDRLVTKDELLNAVWSDTFVTPNVLTRAIAQLRKALGDDATEARYIETATKRGYRFIAPVTVDADAVDETAAQRPATWREHPVSEGGPQGDAHALTPAEPASVPASRGRWSATHRVGGAVVAAVVSVAIGVWVAQSVRERAPNEAAGPVRVKRLTLRTGNNVAPALSPDGAMVAYASDKSGAFEIHVASVALGSREIALTHDGGQNTEPAWSPDGRWIAFHSRARGGIWLVPATGGSPTQVVDVGSQPDWSPDSEWLAFTSSQGAMAAQSNLKVVRRDGSGLRELTRVGTPVGGQRSPKWSRSGRFIAFIVSDGGSSNRVWVVGVEGGTPRELSSIAMAGYIAFGADDRILFATGRLSDGDAIYRLPLDPSTLTPEGEAAVVPVSVGSLTGLSASRTNTVAFAVTTTHANLWAVDQPLGASPGEPFPFTRSTIHASSPAFSPDGSTLAFSQVGAGVPRSVWLMDADGTSQTPLFPDGVSAWPSWDGNHRLLVLRAAKPLAWAFLLIDSRTKRATVLDDIDARGVKNPRLSPDGEAIAYWKLETNGAMNTWIQPRQGGPARRITSDAEGANYPVWSPDGRWLAVELKRGEETNIGVVSRDGGPIEWLTHERGQNWPHSWVGDSIFFAGEREGVWNVFTVSRRTRAIRRITNFTSVSGRVLYPEASPDGRRVVFERSADEGSLWTFDATGSSNASRK